MTNITALAVVLALAGSPVATLTCVGWCVPEGAHTSTTCHDQVGTSGAADLSQADDTCAQLFAGSPFLAEETRLTAPATPSVSQPPASSISAPGEAQLTPERDVRSAAIRRPISPIVLRL